MASSTTAAIDSSSAPSLVSGVSVPVPIADSRMTEIQRRAQESAENLRLAQERLHHQEPVVHVPVLPASRVSDLLHPVVVGSQPPPRPPVERKDAAESKEAVVRDDGDVLIHDSAQQRASEEALLHSVGARPQELGRRPDPAEGPVVSLEPAERPRPVINPFGIPEESAVKAKLISSRACITQLERMNDLRDPFLKYVIGMLKRDDLTQADLDAQKKYLIGLCKKSIALRKLCEICIARYPLLPSNVVAERAKEKTDYDAAVLTFTKLNQVEHEAFLLLQDIWHVAPETLDPSLQASGPKDELTSVGFVGKHPFLSVGLGAAGVASLVNQFVWSSPYLFWGSLATAGATVGAGAANENARKDAWKWAKTVVPANIEASLLTSAIVMAATARINNPEAPVVAITAAHAGVLGSYLAIKHISTIGSEFGKMLQTGANTVLKATKAYFREGYKYGLIPAFATTMVGLGHGYSWYWSSLAGGAVYASNVAASGMMYLAEKETD
jgi:hypothetical protein